MFVTMLHMNIFAHAGHDHEVSNEAVHAAAASNGDNLGIFAVIGLLLIAVIVVGMMYTAKQRDKTKPKKTSQK